MVVVLLLVVLLPATGANGDACTRVLLLPSGSSLLHGGCVSCVNRRIENSARRTAHRTKIVSLDRSTMLLLVTYHMDYVFESFFSDGITPVKRHVASYEFYRSSRVSHLPLYSVHESLYWCANTGARSRDNIEVLFVHVHKHINSIVRVQCTH